MKDALILAVIFSLMFAVFVFFTSKQTEAERKRKKVLMEAEKIFIEETLAPYGFIISISNKEKDESPVKKVITDLMTKKGVIILPTYDASNPHLFLVLGNISSKTVSMGGYHDNQALGEWVSENSFIQIRLEYTLFHNGYKALFSGDVAWSEENHLAEMFCYSLIKGLRECING